jgi:hypothetical protein
MLRGRFATRLTLMKFALALIVGSLFTLVGVGSLVGAALLYRHEQRVGEGVSATGVVVELIERRDARGHGRSYAPVVRFKTSSGEEVEFAASLSTNPASYSVGDKVSVLYDPRRPGNADVDSVASRWFGVVVLIILGIVFATFGVKMWLPGKREIVGSPSRI